MEHHDEGFMSRLSNANVMSDGMLRGVDLTQMALTAGLPRKSFKIKKGRENLGNRNRH